MITIKTKERDFVNSLIVEANSLFEGNSLTGNNIVDFNRISYILSGLIDIKGFDKFSREKGSFVESILWKKEEVKDLKTFEKTAQDLLTEKVTPVRAEILFRSHIRKDNIEQIIKNTNYKKSIRILSKEEYTDLLESSYNVQTQYKSDDFFKEYSKTGVWCVFHSYDKNFRSASSKAIFEIEFLRALINFRLGRGRIQVQSKPMQFSEVSPSKYFFELVDDNIGFWKYSLGQHKTIDKLIDNESLAAVIDFINTVHSLNECSLKDDLKTCIHIYNEALDNYQRDYSFLLIWTIIDILIPDIKNNIKLIKRIYKNISRKQQGIIDILHQKRNLFIHQGKYSIFNISDVNYLKLVVEDLIIFCFNAIEKIRNSNDLTFLLSKVQDRKRTIKEKDIIAYIIEKGLL